MAKMERKEYIKHKSFCTAKKTIYKMKSYPVELVKVFINCMSDKGLISKIHMNLQNSKKP
jgi:hypothetical protein